MDWLWKQVNAAFGHPELDPRYKYKRCNQYLLQLQVTADTKTNEARIVQDMRFAKYRASQLEVCCIYDTESQEKVNELDHWWISGLGAAIHIRYKVGQIAIPDGFDLNVNKICAEGIHYFNTLLGAYHYNNTVSLNGVTFNHNGAICNIKKYGRKWQLGLDIDIAKSWFEACYQTKNVRFGYFN